MNHLYKTYYIKLCSLVSHTYVDGRKIANGNEKLRVVFTCREGEEENGIRERYVGTLTVSLMY